MSWLDNLFRRTPKGFSTPEAVVRFYQQLGFFVGQDPASVLQRYSEEYGSSPDPSKPWDDAFLLALSDDDVWASDPEADVCAENQVYSEVLPAWARISAGAFEPAEISESWEDREGPITLKFLLGDRPSTVSPDYQDDWIDLAVLQQINALIAPSGRRFECFVDGNFALVLCLTSAQKEAMRTQRQFPFVW